MRVLRFPALDVQEERLIHDLTHGDPLRFGHRAHLFNEILADPEVVALPFDLRGGKLKGGTRGWDNRWAFPTLTLFSPPTDHLLKIEYVFPTQCSAFAWPCL